MLYIILEALLALLLAVGFVVWIVAGARRPPQQDSDDEHDSES